MAGAHHANDGPGGGPRASARDDKPDPLGEQVSPTSDGIYRVSHLLPFIRLIKQNRKGISALRRAFLGSWRSSLLPAGQVSVNESVHESTLARFGKRVPQRAAKR